MDAATPAITQALFERQPENAAPAFVGIGAAPIPIRMVDAQRGRVGQRPIALLAFAQRGFCRAHSAGITQEQHPRDHAAHLDHGHALVMSQLAGLPIHHAQYAEPKSIGQDQGHTGIEPHLRCTVN